jgi:hypothetical protein
MPEEVKGTPFRGILMEDPKLVYDEQITNFIFWVILKVYLANTLNNENSLTNFRPNPNIFEILDLNLL